MFSNQSFDSSKVSPATENHPKRFSLKNFKLCPDLRKELCDVAVRRIFAHLINALTAYKREEFIVARNRMDIPHGMFGLSLDEFYERRKGDIAFIDILQLVCKNALDMVKFAIVLDNLEDFVRRILKAHHAGKMEPIFKEIADSRKLLTIDSDIVANLKKNMERLHVLQDALQGSNLRQKRTLAELDNRVYDLQQDIVETQMISGPVEIRYKLNSYDRICDQIKFKLDKVEDDFRETLEQLNRFSSIEHDATNSVRISQSVEIENIKNKLKLLSEKYDHDCEYYDGQIAYKKLSTEMMMNQYRDCLEKLEFFAVDIQRLRAWEEEHHLKKHEQALTLSTEQPNNQK